MSKLEFGNLEFTTRYSKGALPGLDIAFGFDRSANSSERIFHYDCDTRIPTPSSLNPTKEFHSFLWCQPSTPATLNGSFLLTEEQRREGERKAAGCEAALIKASGLSNTDFGQAMAHHFQPVVARIPVDQIRRLIPNFTFAVYLKVHWIHIYCAPNIRNFPCNTFIRFPFAYDFEFLIDKSCDGSKIPEVDIPIRYFELSQFEKDIEREGLEYHRRLDKFFKGLSDGAKPNGQPEPEGH